MLNIIIYLISSGFIYLLLMMFDISSIIAGGIAVIISVPIIVMIQIVPEWKRLVVLKWGRFSNIAGPGVCIIPPVIYSVANEVDMRIEVQQIEATNTLTKDNVPIKVIAAIEFQVEDPKKAVIDVQDYNQAVTWLATEALKNTIGSLTLKQILSDRDEIVVSLKEQIDKEAITYGIDVKAVRITDIDTPPELVEELAVIARSQRAAEAKQIQANAEVAVAEKIAQASKILKSSEGGIRLRELQILNEMSKEESSMIIIYPYGDRTGQEIANATAGNKSKKNRIKE